MKTTNLETSKKLKELGFNNKTEYFWWRRENKVILEDNIIKLGE